MRSSSLRQEPPKEKKPARRRSSLNAMLIEKMSSQMPGAGAEAAKQRLHGLEERVDSMERSAG